jgi:hypothetical protein
MRLIALGGNPEYRREVWKSLVVNGKTVSNWYMFEGSEVINGYLRKDFNQYGPPSDKLERKIRAEVDAMDYDLDPHAVRRRPDCELALTPEPFVVYRGVSGDWITRHPMFLAADKEVPADSVETPHQHDLRDNSLEHHDDRHAHGPSLVDAGFLSTSLSHSYAADFGGELNVRRGEAKATLAIYVPPGTRYLVGTAGEREIVFGRNRNLQFVGVTRLNADRFNGIRHQRVIVCKMS